MPHTRKLIYAFAALFTLFAFAGCGNDSTPSGPLESSSPTSAAGATNATSSTSAPKKPAAKPSPQSSRFAAKLDAICRKNDTSEVEVYYVEAIRSNKDATSDLDEMVASYRRIARAAAALDPPKSAESDFGTYLSALRSLVNLSGSLKAALNSESAVRAATLSRVFSGTLSRRSDSASKLGAENCIMDAAD